MRIIPSIFSTMLERHGGIIKSVMVFAVIIIMVGGFVYAVQGKVRQMQTAEIDTWEYTELNQKIANNPGPNIDAAIKKAMADGEINNTELSRLKIAFKADAKAKLLETVQ